MATEMSIASRVETLISLAPSGFAMAYHVNFTRPAFLIQNYPAEWTQIYASKGYMMVDPTVKWGFENVGNVLWSDLLALDSDGVLAASAPFGLAYGFTHVIETDGSRTITSFARPDREFRANEIDAIAAQVDAIHAATEAKKAIDDADLAALRQIAVDVTQA